MDILDITFDFETCALCPTAAVMSIGAVAWGRDFENTPFFGEGNGMKTLCQFYKHVDLRSQFLDGFTFDASTSIWWKEKDSKAKQELLSDDDTTPLLSIEGVMEHFFAWIKGLSEDLSADNIYLWAQGTDFDIAILRHICHRYNKQIPVRYTKFRDHRTFFLEGARLLSRGGRDEIRYSDFAEDFDDGENIVHSPLYDCKRSIYSTWQMMKQLKQCVKEKVAE